MKAIGVVTLAKSDKVLYTVKCNLILNFKKIKAKTDEIISGFLAVLFINFEILHSAHCSILKLKLHKY